MDKLVIEGPAKLSGSVEVSRSKNAYLPILAAVLLSDKPVHLKNLPNLRDIRTMIKLLENLGVTVTKNDNVTTLCASNLASHEATYDLVKTMRASICVLGPLLGRIRKAHISLPGGCAIGSRPIDLHLSNLEKMGTRINLDCGYVDAETDGLVGCHLILKFPSVGATENLMMAAVFARGETIIENVALEPEIDDLANFLNAMGAKVSGIGTKTLTIKGVIELKEVTYEAIGDRIEAATYVIAGLITNSTIEVTGVNPHFIEAVIEVLRDMGANIDTADKTIKVRPSNLKGSTIETAPFPGFPTDVQAQMTALLTIVSGSSLVTENIFENRFMHVPELNRLGAKMTLKSNSVFIEGESELVAAPVMCTDLRASAALVIAALASKGTTEILRVYHLDRGYENLDGKLKKLGVNIQRINSQR